MARYVHARNNFIFGEVSPKFYGRNDIEQYKSMCEELKNFVVRPQGGVERRPPTYLKVQSDTNLTASSGAGKSKLIPFRGLSSDSMLVLCDDNSNTFLKYYSVGSFSGSASVTTTTLTSIAAIDGASGANSGALDTDWDFSSTAKIRHAQYSNVLIITDGDQLPLVIDKNSGTLKYYVWGFTVPSIVAGASVLSYSDSHRAMPWETENSSGTTITPSATTGSGITLTASAALFTSNMVGTTARRGTMFRIRSGSTVGVALITGYTNSTTVTATVLRTLPGTAGYLNWSESAWSRRKGFPRSVAFHNGRVCFLGNDENPDRVWFSQLEDIYELSPADPSATLTTTDAFDVLPLAEPANGAWLVPKYDLIIGTGRSAMRATSIDRDVSMGRDNTELREEILRGFSRTQPVKLGDSIYAVSDSGRELHEVFYDTRSDGYISANMSFFGEHIVREHAIYDPGVLNESAVIEEIAAQESAGIIWAKTTYGGFLSFTRNREYNTMAWAYHELGGASSSGDGAPMIRSIACARGGIGEPDQLHLIVNRTVNGSTKMTIEWLSVQNEAREMWDDDIYTVGYESPVHKHVHLDCLFAPTDGAGETWTGITHLASSTVSVVADGSPLPDEAVSAGGVITLDTTFTNVLVGLNYESKIVPVSLEANALLGNGLGQIKRTDELTILFERTSSCKYGTETYENDLITLNFRETTVPAADPTPLFTGEKTVKLPASYERQQKIVITSDGAYPCNINSIICKGILSD